MRPARQSDLACSMRSFEDDTKFQSMKRGPRGSPPSVIRVDGTIAFTQSPVAGMVLVVLVLAAAALYGIRRLPEDSRQFAQYAVLGALALFAALAWVLRAPIIALFNATGEGA